MIRKFFVFPVYPLLLAISFPLGVVAENGSLFDLASTVLVLVIIAILWASVHLAAYFACRRGLPLAGLVTALVLTALLFPDNWMVSSLDPLALGSHVPGALVVGGLVSVLLYLRERMADRFTMMANIGVLASLSVPALGLFGSLEGAAPRVEAFTPSGTSALVAGETAAGENWPNIHHIVLDAYSSPEIMRDLYGHDASRFVEGLEALGFAVARRSWAPYNQTYYSMAATFQGDFIDPDKVQTHAPRAETLRRALGRLVVDGPVHGALRKLGYRFVATEPGMDRFFRFPPSTRVAAPAGGHRHWIFEHYFFRETRLFLLPPLRRWIERRNQSAINRAIRNAFATVVTTDGAGSESGRRPFHLYQHILAPHAPFSMTRTGDDDFVSYPHFAFMDNGQLESYPERRPEYRLGYREKALYVEAATLAQVRRIIETTPDPKLIVVQSDHGGSSRYANNSWRQSCLKERFANFTAIYASDQRGRAAFAERLATSYNTINIYRDIFRLYFAADTPPLDNRSVYVPWNAPRQTWMKPRHLRMDCPDGG